MSFVSSEIEGFDRREGLGSGQLVTQKAAIDFELVTVMRKHFV